MHERRFVERQLAKLPAFAIGERHDVVVKAGHLHPAVANPRAPPSCGTSALAGLVTPPPNVPECRSCFGPVSRSSK